MAGYPRRDPAELTAQGSGYLLAACNLICLRPFLTLNDVKLNVIAFLQAFVSIDLDRAVVDEDVGAVISSDKSISLRVVKPLHFTFMLSHEPLTFLTADCGWE
jgi:hypothetical protein